MGVLLLPPALALVVDVGTMPSDTERLKCSVAHLASSIPLSSISSISSNNYARLSDPKISVRDPRSLAVAMQFGQIEKIMRGGQDKDEEEGFLRRKVTPK